MMKKSEVYYKWLGISPDDQPPDHYRLLGVPRFETDEEVIRNAADRQNTHVRRLARNEFTEVGQELLNEIMAARICLLKPDKRSAYDATLEPITPPPPNSEEEPTDTSSANSTKETIPRQSSLVIGADPSCDFVVDHATVSSIHCKVSVQGDVVQIKDLGSTNGTYVNLRKIKKATVTPTDVLTLGPDFLLKLPSDLMPHSFSKADVRLIGRSKHCDVRIEHPSVSLFHAKIYARGAQTYIEDLNSTNGTQLMVSDGAMQTVQGPTRLDCATAVRFGTHVIDLNELR